MNRAAFALVPLLALTLAAAPSWAATFRMTAAALPPPPPPPPAEQPEQAFVPAPVPNPDMQRPASSADNGPSAQLTPNLASRQGHYPGQGFISGSAANYDPNRRFHPSPGLRLSVPLQ